MMAFNSYIFIFLFLPVTVLVYFLLGWKNLKVRNWFLVFAGLFFYGYYNVRSLILLLVSLAFNYLCIFLLRKGKQSRTRALVITVIFNAGLLICFKLAGFGLSESQKENYFMPAALSFITFSQIAYAVAVYRKEIKKVNLLDYLSYVLFFPKLLMGPFTEPTGLIKQVNDRSKVRINADNLVAGLRLFSFGLFKKIIFADRFSKVVNWGFESYQSISSMDVFIVMLCYTFQIYFDFSGYSDMAIGIAKMLNIDLPINFNSPYKAVSIQDFWKRWHISLTQFLTKYIYIPLGGSRKGNIITCINIMIVFLVSGFWHGSNTTFILWGAIYGLLMIFDRYVSVYHQKLSKTVRWIIAFFIINMLWLLFRADSVDQWLQMLGTLFRCENTAMNEAIPSLLKTTEIRLLLDVLSKGQFLTKMKGFFVQFYLAVALAICLIPRNLEKTETKRTVIGCIGAGLALTWCILSMVGESVFIYQNF